MRMGSLTRGIAVWKKSISLTAIQYSMNHIAYTINCYTILYEKHLDKRLNIPPIHKKRIIEYLLNRYDKRKKTQNKAISISIKSKSKVI